MMETGRRVYPMILVCLVAALAVSQGCTLLRGPQNLQGTSRGKAVRNPVHILRDAQGVPHVIALDEGDLYFGLGYVMAHDRLFQMDVYRGAAQGRLAEIFGDLPLGAGLHLAQLDVLLRSFEIRDHVAAARQEMSPSGSYLLARFVAGINSFVGEAAHHRPPEYKLLGLLPSAWDEEDVLGIPEVMAIGMAAMNVETEVIFDTLFERLGQEPGRDLFYLYTGRRTAAAEKRPGQALGTFREGQEWGPGGQGLPLVSSLFSTLSHWMPQGSNNWVISGTRSDTGHPILANDPHVPVGLAPNFWYHVHLSGGGLEVEGLMYPGYPGFAAGWNGRVAWGVTNMMADQIDLYREKVDPKSPDLYEYEGRWERFATKEERVKVRLCKDVTFVHRSGRHGFVIPSAILQNKYGRETPLFKWPVCLRWIDTMPGRFFEGQVSLARAKDRGALMQALEQISYGPLAFNYVWADVEGNIGYRAVGRIPIRQDNQGSLVKEGWHEGGEWEGYVAFDKIPHYENPKEGFLVSANNMILPEDFPYYVTDDYVLPLRAERIRELLSTKPQCSTDDVMAFQADVFEGGAKRLVRYLEDALAKRGGEGKLVSLEAAAWGILRSWDAMAHAQSAGAAIYEVWFTKVIWNTFSDEFGKDLSEVLFMNMIFGEKLMDRLLDMPESRWFDDIRTKEKETRDDILILSFKDAVRELKDSMGRDPATWQWGTIHPLYLTHPFGFIPLLGKPFRIATLSYPGDNDTVNAGYFISEKGKLPVVMGAASRFIVDFSRPDGAWFNCSTGMSGDPFSKYFDNLTEGWFRHQYFWTSRLARGEDIKPQEHLVLER